jgi:hypothetical protein
MNLGFEWAGLLFGFGSDGWLKAISFLYSYCSWATGLMGFGPLVNFWTFGFGLLWTEKMGLYI